MELCDMAFILWFMTATEIKLQFVTPTVRNIHNNIDTHPCHCHAPRTTTSFHVWGDDATNQRKHKVILRVVAVVGVQWIPFRQIFFFFLFVIFEMGNENEWMKVNRTIRSIQHKPASTEWWWYWWWWECGAMMNRRVDTMRKHVTQWIFSSIRITCN